MARIQIHHSLLTHKMTYRMALILHEDRYSVVGHLVALWLWSIDNAPDGALPIADCIIEHAAMWEGERGELVKALVASGYVRDDGNGHRELTHIWTQPKGRLVKLVPADLSNPLGEWQEIRLQVIARDGYVCGICNSAVAQDDIDIDHIHPRSKGGSNDLNNLRVTHSRCNRSKGNR